MEKQNTTHQTLGQPEVTGKDQSTSQPFCLAGGWLLVLVYSERKVLLAGCWLMFCSERKVLLVGG
jgi:hypothetical protein